MPSFGKTSARNLATCEDDIQRVLNEAIKYVDFSVIYGHRGEAVQNKAFAEGHSTKRFPYSKHNKMPSQAVDILPFPSGWPQDADSDQVKLHKIAHFYFVGGVVMTCAEQLGIKLRWGADWNMDKSFLDQNFDDLAHFEKV